MERHLLLTLHPATHPLGNRLHLPLLEVQALPAVLQHLKVLFKRKVTSTEIVRSPRLQVLQFFDAIKATHKKFVNELDKELLFNSTLLKLLEPNWIQFADKLPQIKPAVIAAMPKPPESWAQLIFTLLMESKEQLTVEDFIAKLFDVLIAKNQ